MNYRRLFLVRGSEFEACSKHLVSSGKRYKIIFVRVTIQCQVIMKLLILFCCILIARAQIDSCETFCACEGHVASCMGMNQFPSFFWSGWIHNLILIDGTFNELTPVTKLNFPNLKTLVLRNCRFITCSDINSIIDTWPELVIEADNNCETTTTADITTEIIDTTTDDTTTTNGYSTTPANVTTPNTPDSTQYHDTVLIASISTVAGVVLIIIITLVSVKMYKKFKTSRRQPIVRPCLELMDITYENYGYTDSTV